MIPTHRCPECTLMMEMVAMTPNTIGFICQNCGEKLDVPRDRFKVIDFEEETFWRARYDTQHEKVHAMEDFIAELREILARASRMAEQERAEMTQQILQEGLH